MKKIFFIGAGGHFREIFHWYNHQVRNDKSQSHVVGVIDDNLSNKKFEEFTKLKIIKSKDLKNEKDIYLILSTGILDVRIKILKQFKKFNFETLIHPSAQISEGATFGKGNVFSPNTVIAGNAKIGNFNNFNFNCAISHDCNIGENNVLSPSTSLMGDCRIGNLNFFGANSTMVPKTKIDDNNIIGAGAVLTKSFGSNNTIVGVPGKKLATRFF